MQAKIILTLYATAFAVSAHADGFTSTLYMTTANRFNIEILGGTTTAIITTQQFNSQNGEAAIAVSGGSIRTAATSNYQGYSNGGTYDLNFNATGPGYSTSAINIFDGTTDGFNNYGVNTFTSTVYSYNLNWGSPSVLFTSAGNRPIGITYDQYNSSLWISDNRDGVVRDYTLGGILLSSFNTGFSSGSCVAFDPADQTLWLMHQSTSGIIDQFSTTGVHLQTVSFGAGYAIEGAEFEIDPVPEPTVTVLFGLSGLASFVALRRVK